MMQTKLYQQQVVASLLVIPYIAIAQITTPNPTKSPTNSPTNSPILTSITGCPPLWTADNTPAPPPGSEKYQRGSIVSNPFAGSGTIRNVYQCSSIESYYLFCPLSAFEPGNPTYQWEIAWTLLGSCDSSTPYISPTTSPTSAAPTFAVWSGTGCPREFDSSLLTPYELGDVVTYDTNDGQGSLVYECISNVIGRCYQGGYTPGEPFVNEAWSVLGTCTGTLTPTTSPTETVLAPWTLGGCPESFVGQTRYEEGDVVEDNGKVYECKGFPYNGLCGQSGYEPGGDPTYYLIAWTSRGSCTGTLQPSPAPTTVPLPVWEKTGCPEEYDDDPESVTSYGEGDFVSLDGVVYKCTNVRCNQDGYEPDSALGEETWDIEGSCTGTIAPSTGPNLPAWSLGPGCPQEFQWGEDVNGVVTVGIPSAYEADTYVHVNERVYQCKDGVNAGFCKIHAPDGTFGYLGWIDLERSCDDSLSIVPQPNEGGGGGGAITVFNTKAGYTEYGPGCPPLFEVCVTANGCGADGIQQDDLVSNPCSTDSSLSCAYECKVACGRAGYEPGVPYPPYGALWIQDFTELGSCTSDPFTPPASDVPQGDVLPPWEFGGCPDAWDDSVTYIGGDYVSSSSTVYKCKNGPDEQFCNLIPPEGLNGHSGSLGWETIGSCTGTLDPLPAPTCGDIPTYTEDFLTNANWESEPQQVVNVDGTIYRCQTFFAATAWCSNSQYDPTGMAGYLAWDTCTSCASYEATGSLGSNCPDVAS